MYHVVKGSLGTEPQLQKRTIAGEERSVVNATIFVKRPGKDADIPVRVSAWDKNAEELAKCNKGDTIDFIGSPTINTYTPVGCDKSIKSMGYSVQHIDQTEKLNKEYQDFIIEHLKVKNVKVREEKPRMNVVIGTLAEKPKLESRNVDGTDTKVLNTTVYVRTNSGKESIPVNITAWGEKAEQICNNAEYDKGKTISFIGDPKLDKYTLEGMDKPISKMKFTVVAIDADRELFKASNEMCKNILKAEGKVKEKAIDKPAKAIEQDRQKQSAQTKEKSATKQMEANMG